MRFAMALSEVRQPSGCETLLDPSPAEEEIEQDSHDVDPGLEAGLNGCLVSSKACSQVLAY